MSAPPQASQRPPEETRYAAMVRRVTSPGALWLAGAWGFAEATFFFIVPDVWLGLVALFAPRRMLVTLAAIIAGAVLGAVALFLATLVSGDALTPVITSLPGIVPADLEQARAELADQGVVAFLNGIVQGLPVKLYIHASALEGIGLVDVAVFTALNRVERMLVFGVVLMAVGWGGRSLIARWPRLTAALYLLAWVIFYTGFLLSRAA